MRYFKPIPGAMRGFDYWATPGIKRWSIGIDLGTQQDHTAVVGIEQTIAPAMTWDGRQKQTLEEPVSIVRSAHRLKLKLDYAKIVEHICTLRDKDVLKDPDTVYVVDVSGVGKAVGSMLNERGFFFHPVTWVAGDGVKEHHTDGWRVGKQYLMAQLGAALSSSRLQILDGLRDGPEIEKQLADYQVEFTQAGNMTMNAAPGAHDDYVAALSLAWFGLMHCSGSLGPPQEVRW